MDTNAMKKSKKNRSWVVTCICEVVKKLVCEGCTEDEARKNPFDYAVDETEVAQNDWRVTEVEENR